MQHIKPWWGDFELAEGTAGCWTIGPARLYVEHRPHEWRIGYLLDETAEASAVQLGLPLGQMPAQARLSRYSFQVPAAQLSLRPLLADRPVISRPDVNLFIPPAQSIQLYVSTPLWVQVRAQGELLQEQAVVRPSDTWSGPTTRPGGLAYAASTMARTSLDDFPYSAWRAVTPLRITNRGTDMAAVERLYLPVPFLSLYQAVDGTLWTQAVELTRSGDEVLELERMGSEAPVEAGGSVLLSEPRRRADRGLLSKAFGTLFGRGGSDDGMD
ncbi:hypothetical protein [Sulfurivermis fontis]|jgi:hypothetical protein|uniref:hypothetical protein n=1 Tax=Sulfurivermis fontis TaxID=1972068 RepID=UPI000FDB7922|nr:hypothetical protein [Sulfurivermis fontis]